MKKINIKNIFNNPNIKLSSKQKIIFLEQLSNLLNSWIPIINSFKILEFQTKDKKTKKIIKNSLDLLSKWQNTCTNAQSKWL